MKISVIIPTYNNTSTIVSTLKSLLWQNYHNWDAVIVDNASIDDTKKRIVTFKERYDKDNKITLVHKNISGSFNDIIISGSKYVNGDIYLILKSTDILYDENVFSNINEYFASNDVDAIIYDIPKINELGENIGIDYTHEYKINSLFPITLLNKGKSLYENVVYKKNVFFDTIIKNLIWNFPFYLDIDQNKELNVKKVIFSVIKSRINNDDKISKFINELILVNELLNNYKIPLYILQNKLLKLCKSKYKVISINKRTTNKYHIFKYMIESNFSNDEINSNYYLTTILNFYKNYNIKVVKAIYVENVNKVSYYGKDIVKFISNCEDSIYQIIMDEMNEGFNEIIVDDKFQKENIENILKFLCLYGSINVVINNLHQ